MQLFYFYWGVEVLVDDDEADRDEGEIGGWEGVEGELPWPEPCPLR